MDYKPRTFKFIIHSNGDRSVGIGALYEEVEVTIKQGGWDLEFYRDFIEQSKDFYKSMFDYGATVKVYTESEWNEIMKHEYVE